MFFIQSFFEACNYNICCSSLRDGQAPPESTAVRGMLEALVGYLERGNSNKLLDPLVKVGSDDTVHHDTTSKQTERPVNEAMRKAARRFGLVVHEIKENNDGSGSAAGGNTNAWRFHRPELLFVSIPWACDTCTLENGPEATACMACGKSRPAKKKGRVGHSISQRHESEVKMPEAVAEADIANLGEKQHIKYMLDEYKFNTALVDKITNLAGDYLSFRSARGDGNCYYRAVSCSWYEYLIGEAEERAKFIANLDSWALASEYMMGQKNVARDLLVEMGTIADDLGADAAREKLEGRLLNDGVSDRAVIETFRYVASQYIKNNPTLETPSGMTIETFIKAMDGQMTVEQYCQQVVETWGEDARDAVHIALPPALGIQVRIVYLDRSEGNDLMKIDFPSVDGKAKRPFQVTVLLKPGHYDILYPVPPGTEGYFVNFKTGDRVMVFYPKQESWYGGKVQEVKLMDLKPRDTPRDEKVEYTIAFDDGDVAAWPQRDVKICDESQIAVVAAPVAPPMQGYSGYGEQGGYDGGAGQGRYGVVANPPAGINYQNHGAGGRYQGQGGGYQCVNPGAVGAGIGQAQLQAQAQRSDAAEAERTRDEDALVGMDQWLDDAQKEAAAHHAECVDSTIVVGEDTSTAGEGKAGTNGVTGALGRNVMTMTGVMVQGGAKVGGNAAVHGVHNLGENQVKAVLVTETNKERKRRNRFVNAKLTQAKRLRQQAHRANHPQQHRRRKQRIGSMRNQEERTERRKAQGQRLPKSCADGLSVQADATERDGTSATAANGTRGDAGTTGTGGHGVSEATGASCVSGSTGATSKRAKGATGPTVASGSMGNARSADETCAAGTTRVRGSTGATGKGGDTATFDATNEGIMRVHLGIMAIALPIIIFICYRTLGEQIIEIANNGDLWTVLGVSINLLFLACLCFKERIQLILDDACDDARGHRGIASCGFTVTSADIESMTPRLSFLEREQAQAEAAGKMGSTGKATGGGQ